VQLNVCEKRVGLSAFMRVKTKDTQAGNANATKRKMTIGTNTIEAMHFSTMQTTSHAFSVKVLHCSIEKIQNSRSSEPTPTAITVLLLPSGETSKNLLRPFISCVGYNSLRCKALSTYASLINALHFLCYADWSLA
jgi:hypothetical protein